jgi:hypothetical protein
MYTLRDGSDNLHVKQYAGVTTTANSSLLEPLDQNEANLR